MIRRLTLAVTAAATLLAAVPAGSRWWGYVQFLAADKLQGRLTGSQGYRDAAAYVAGEFERAGLLPAGEDGYMQAVRFHVRRLKEAQSSLELVRNGESEELVLGEDAVIRTRIDPAPSVDAEVVFAGYGLTVPEMHYDDLAGLDLRGKIVLYLSGGPSRIPGALSAHYQSPLERGKFLQRAGAIGVIAIPNPHHMDLPWPRIASSSLQPSMSLADAALDPQYGLKFAALLNPAHAEKWFAGSGHSFDDLVALAEAGKPLPRFPLHLSIRARVVVDRSEAESDNVAGILPGSDPQLKSQFVVLSAHLDHMGTGAAIQGDRIYNGAMDNASGVATLLDIAHSLHDSKAKLRRSLLFLVVTGEEEGLLGSRYFVAHPTVSAGSMVADLNVDMFLPLFPLHTMTVYGLNESSLGEEIRTVAKIRGVRVQDDPEPQRNIFIRSDQYSFVRQGIPSLAFSVGYEKGSSEEKIAKSWLKERYHAPSDDTKQPVDLECAARFNYLVRALAEAVANHPARPRWLPTSFFRLFPE